MDLLLDVATPTAPRGALAGTKIFMTTGRTLRAIDHGDGLDMRTELWLADIVQVPAAKIYVHILYLYTCMNDKPSFMDACTS